nr:hypothetical protein [Micromonospora sp. DSM 115978]
ASVSDECRRIMLVDGPAVLGWLQWRDADARHSVRHLDDVLAELAAAGRITVPSVPAASALLSGAMNDAAIWIADQTDRAVATRDVWTTLQPMINALRSTGRTALPDETEPPDPA